MDLSENGRQPMASHSGRFVVCYNGEIYNHGALRAKLEPLGHVFSGHSDTEVMLAAIEQWGVKRAIAEFIGMFAIALWDRRERTLTLVRDRLGIKPLYYSWQNGTLAFGSEMKALREVEGLNFLIDRTAVWRFIQKSYVSGNRSIYHDVHHLQPGHLLILQTQGLPVEPKVERYWSLPPEAPAGQQFDFADAIETLDTLLKDSVSLRLLADVPVGLFLSGGIDSSLICAVARSVNSAPLKTYSIGFADRTYDEAGRARAVADYLGLDHHIEVATEEDALSVIPELAHYYDEPFADSSQIPTLLLSRMTREHVTVALSGDGGDEMFAGYDRYFLAQQMFAARRWLPRALAPGAAAALTAPSPQSWDRALETASGLLPARYRKPEMGSLIHRFARMLLSCDQASLYQGLTARWGHLERPLVLGFGTEASSLAELSLEMPDLVSAMTRLDLTDWLPGDILTKVDRASMSVALEARVPMLDHRLVEFSQALPISAKVRGGTGKWILRELLGRYVPRELWDRPKQGFNVPLASWLRGRLKPWAEALLAPTRLDLEGFLQSGPIAQCWSEHIAGTRDWSPELWNVLMFQSWLERNHPELARG